MLVENVAWPYLVTTTVTRVAGLAAGAYALKRGADLWMIALKARPTRGRQTATGGEVSGELNATGWSFSLKDLGPGSFFAVVGVVIIVIALMAKHPYSQTRSVSNARSSDPPALGTETAHAAPLTERVDANQPDRIGSAHNESQRSNADQETETVVTNTQPSPDDGTFEVSGVEQQPELVNRAAVSQALVHNYPPLLRNVGVVGTVTLRFRVLEDGTVDPGSISVQSATHDVFADAARRVAESMRFRPAMIGRRAVRAWIDLPITFEPRQ
jgi:TonB family protein